MKPDQHKQKKSAQYKKKHGIQGKGNVELEKGKGNYPKGRGKGRGQTAKHDQEPNKSFQKSETAASSENQSQEIGPAVVVPQKHFQRREVVSNWERYEGLDESSREYEAQRGADFTTVLTATTGSLAQFRLQSERDWDLDGEQEADLPGDSGYLSVNVAELAAAIQCVPLHTRLGLEQELFGEDVIEHFNKDAFSKLQAYQADPKRKNKNFSSVTPEQSSLPSEPIQRESGETTASEAVCDTKKDVDSDEGCDVLEEILNLNTENTEPAPKQSSTKADNGPDTVCDNRTKRDNATVSGKSEPNKNSKSAAAKKYAASCHVNVQKQEEELDFLLALDTPEKHSAKDENQADSDSSDNNESNKKSSNATVKSDGAKSENLDDWLDSMLDDDD